MHVRKIYVEGDAGGAATAYWEQLWRRRDEVDARGVSTILGGLLDRFLPPTSTVLEAGCGTADVVTWLGGAGRTAIGVDLATDALHRARQRSPAARLAVADITALPFADGAFDGLVSLGVVEHFEAGPEPVLREQRRVLRPGGTLFLTVPRVSWYRHWSDFRHLTLTRHTTYVQKGRRVAARRALEVEAGPGAFHQYEFPTRWIVGLVEACGFTVTATVPVGVSEATADGPALRRIARLAGSAPDDGEPSPPTAAGDGAATPPSRATLSARLKGAAHRTTVGEAGVGPVGRPVTWLTRHAIAHQVLVVARAC
jgi:SAM-dependent methyltransferase